MNIKKKHTSQAQDHIVQNRRARFDYSLETQFEAGIVLEGWEVKSLRAKKVQLTGNFVSERKGELFLAGVQIEPLASASTHIQTRPVRHRKLLMHRKEINQVIDGIRKQGRTCVCISMYWKAGKAKARLALAQGKKQHDKRAASRKRDWQQEQHRILKRKSR